MSPNPFAERPPGAINFTSLISNVSRLLASGLKTRIRNDLDPLQAKSTLANEEHCLSTHDALVSTADDLAKAKKEIDALNAYFDAAAKHATRQLKFHSDLKSYVERTTDQLALRSELCAPIRKLPNEVLQLIFLEVHAQERRRGQNYSVTAQVCTFWRQLALATPVLWTYVNVDLKGDEEDGLQAVAYMKTQIERAKCQLVTVVFSMKRKKIDSSQAPEAATNLPRTNCHFKAAIDTLLECRDRVGKLDIPHHEADLGGYLVKRCAAENITFENLHTLSLYEDQYYHSLPDFDAQLLLKACPNVNRLRIYEAPDTPDLHWERMKEFKGRLETAALTTFLSRAQDVRQAEISSSCWSLVPNLTFSDRLTALSLDLHPDSAETLANIPPPPGLRCLALSDNHISALTLLRSWGSVLEFLGLSFDIKAKYLRTLLPTVPNLRCLRLCGDRLGGTPINLFNFLPKLTHLEIHSSVDRFSKDSVQRLLSRPLKRNPRAKRLPLGSVTFLPRFQRFYDDRGGRVGGFEGLWADIYGGLVDAGIKVVEGRHREMIPSPAFATPFFKERGFVI